MLHHAPPLVLYGLCAALLWASAPSGSHAQVYRCGNTYSDAPCASGTTRIVEVEPAVSDNTRAAQQPIYLCRLGKRQFWSAQSCQSQNASMLRSQSVSKDWSWEQQWKHAEREWQRAQRNTPSPAATPHYADTSASAQRKRARPDCAQAEQRIKKLDEMGRRGGSSSFMDRIRTERKELRDWQFNAGC